MGDNWIWFLALTCMSCGYFVRHTNVEVFESALCLQRRLRVFSFSPPHLFYGLLFCVIQWGLSMALVLGNANQDQMSLSMAEVNLRQSSSPGAALTGSTAYKPWAEFLRNVLPNDFTPGFRDDFHLTTCLLLTFMLTLW